MATKVSELPTTTTLNAGDLLMLVQGATSKAIASSDLISAGSIVTGPAATSEDSIPQWDADTCVLKDGLGLVTTVGDPGSNSNLPTEMAVRTAIGAMEGWASVFADIEANPTYETEAAGVYTPVPDWAADTAYLAGEFVKPTVANGFIYECIEGGTSNDVEGEPVWGIAPGDDTTEDDGVVWRCRGLNVVETTADLSASVIAGLPLRYEYDGTTYYGVVKHVSATRIAIAGAPLDGTEALTDLSYGPAHKVVPIRLFVPGAWSALAENLLENVALTGFRWGLSSAKLVAFGLRADTEDSTTPGRVNVTINGGAVSDDWDDDGLELDAVGWHDNPPVSIRVASYAVERGDALELACTVAGGTGDAENLTAELLFVLI